MVLKNLKRKVFKIRLTLYKNFLKCTLIQWRQSIYPQFTQEAEGNFIMKSPVCILYLKDNRNNDTHNIIFVCMQVIMLFISHLKKLKLIMIMM